MTQKQQKLRKHILSLRVSDAEWGVIQNCAVQKGARVSEVMRDALRIYMQKTGNRHFGKET
jgi:hypothetical protein